jgi:hypothetical protein
VGHTCKICQYSYRIPVTHQNPVTRILP